MNQHHVLPVCGAGYRFCAIIFVHFQIIFQTNHNLSSEVIVMNIHTCNKSFGKGIMGAFMVESFFFVFLFRWYLARGLLGLGPTFPNRQFNSYLLYIIFSPLARSPALEFITDQSIIKIFLYSIIVHFLFFDKKITIIIIIIGLSTHQQ